MSFTLTVLGSSGTYAGAQGACSGFLVRSADTTVMLDAGPGTLGNLQQHVALDALDAVVLSHCHPDHWLELPVMRNAFRYVLQRSGVELYLTAETEKMAMALCSGELEPTFSPHVITDRSQFDVGSLHFTCSATDHPVETMAVRVDHDGHQVWVDNDKVALTALEFRLLATLLARRGRVQTRDTLLADVWGLQVDVTTRTVDTHVQRLRKKLGPAGRYIETLRGVGYRFLLPDRDGAH